MQAICKGVAVERTCPPTSAPARPPPAPAPPACEASAASAPALPSPLFSRNEPPWALRSTMRLPCQPQRQRACRCACRPGGAGLPPRLAPFLAPPHLSRLPALLRTVLRPPGPAGPDFTHPPHSTFAIPRLAPSAPCQNLNRTASWLFPAAPAASDALYTCNQATCERRPRRYR